MEIATETNGDQWSCLRKRSSIFFSTDVTKPASRSGGEDGVLDGQGNIAGHGTDPTGKVGDIAALAKAVKALFSVTVQVNSNNE